MGLKKCPECGHSISEKARYCPECGCEIDYSVDKELFSRKKSDNTDTYQNDINNMKENIKYKNNYWLYENGEDTLYTYGYLSFL